MKLLQQPARIRDYLPGDEAAVQKIVATVLAEYGLAFEGAGADADLLDIGESYIRRGGVFRIVLDDTGAVAGCGGLLPGDPGETELRKMYFLPAIRGRGNGRRLLEDLVSAARSAGYQRIVLETASVLKEAISLYRAFGFRQLVGTPRTRRCDLAFAFDLTAGAKARGTEEPADP